MCIQVFGHPPLAIRFLSMSYNWSLYHLVLEPSITSRVWVMDWVSYRIEWAVIDVGFGSIVVCYDPKCLKWLKCNLNRCVYKLLDTFLVQASFQGWGLYQSDLYLCLLYFCRSPRLQRLSLYCSNTITGKGFSRAIRNWKAVEEMSLGPLNGRYYAHIIREIGIQCKKLQVLNLCSFDINVYVAALIAENLRDLKELRLQDLSISRAGLHAILSKCRKLVKVSITYCAGLEPKNVEIRSTEAGCKIKWLIGTETKAHSLNSMLDSLVTE